MTNQTETESVTTSTGSNLTISADAFERTLVDLPEKDADTLRWSFYLSKERHWSLGDLSKRTGLSTSTLSRVFRGLYQADIKNVLTTIRQFRKTWEEGGSSANPDFITTACARKLFFAADKARATQSVVLCWGDMGIGKTTSLDEYVRRNNHGRTVLVRCPASPSFWTFLSYVAKATGNPPKGNTFILRDKVVGTLSNGNKLLIVDELHQAFTTTRGDTALRICEFLREIYDGAGCGLLLCGTNVLRDRFDAKEHSAILAQLRDRGTIVVQLPAKPTKTDVEKFITHYALPAPDEETDTVIQDILRSAGLRKLVLHLRDGQTHANKLGESYTWDHFLKARRVLASLATA